jgi:DNA-binding response OmpR family regulator
MSKETKQSQRNNVLIVEDSIDFSNLLKFLIEDDGLNGVQFPIDGDDIIAWATEHKPVTILMDLALRRKDGFAYIGELKANPATKNIPIIIISGRDLTQREILELQMQNIKYLRKGRVEINEIKKEIRESAGLNDSSPKS